MDTKLPIYGKTGFLRIVLSELYDMEPDLNTVHHIVLNLSSVLLSSVKSVAFNEVLP